MKKITPFLWFDNQAEAAAKFYTSIFKRSKITSVSPMSTSFTLEGQDFIGLNGGPHHHFTPAISIYVDCVDQKEVDTLWRKLLSGGGKASRCGWLEDKYGLSWQVIPRLLVKMLSDKDPKKAQASMAAMMTMQKIDLAKLQKAYDSV